MSTAGARSVAKSLLAGRDLRETLEVRATIGTFLIELPRAEAVTSLAVAGFDFVVLDMEHSSMDVGCLKPLILAAHAANLPVIVRPWAQDTGLLGKILDMGANGVMVPHVSTPERAREVVEACRFTPLGHRGFSPISAFDGMEDPLGDLADAVFVILQIEGADALARVEEIAAVPGVDAVFVGPYDLALSMGVTPGSQEVFNEAEKIAGQVSGLVNLGIYLDDPAVSGEWARRGFGLQCVSFDGRMFANAARAVVTTARNSNLKPSE